MLEEAGKELDARQGHLARRLGSALAVAEGDLAGLNPLQPGVADRGAEHVPPRVVEHLVAPTGGLTMHDPIYPPHNGRELAEEPGLLQPRARVRAAEQ